MSVPVVGTSGGCGAAARSCVGALARFRAAHPTVWRDELDESIARGVKLLRSRHLVLLASLRERIVGELAAQPLTSAEAAVEVASAHLFEQSRRDAFNRLAAHDALMVDAEPQRLGIELVNCYQAAKGAGLI